MRAPGEGDTSLVAFDEACRAWVDGDAATAVAALDRALAADDTLEEARFLLAQIAARQGQPEEALPLLEHVAAHAADPALRGQAARLLRWREWQLGR